MKNYSSNRAQKGKTAYRTPSLFKANKAMQTSQLKMRSKKTRNPNIEILNKSKY